MGLKEMKDVLLYIARSELLELAALGHCGSDDLSKLKKGTGKPSSAPSADTKGTYPLTSPVQQLWLLRECTAESGQAQVLSLHGLSSRQCWRQSIWSGWSQQLDPAGMFFYSYMPNFQ